MINVIKHTFRADIIPLQSLTGALRTISATSMLVLLIGFVFEILYSQGTSLAHLKLLLVLGFAFGAWALCEWWISIHRLEDRQPFRKLGWILGLQIAIPIVRYLFLNESASHATSNWINDQRLLAGWHFTFWFPYAVTFFFINQAVLQIYSRNDRLRVEAREEQMLTALNAMAMARDNETGNHILRTQHFVRILAEHLAHTPRYQGKIHPHQINVMVKAAPLHDLGKVGIPDRILKKEGILDAEEWEIMKTHTNIGEAILSSAIGSHFFIHDDVLTVARQIAFGHHEKWDGTGYPQGLSGDQIPLPARIMALADVYDALVSERVYKKSWTHEAALTEIQAKKGTHFDPDVVDALVCQAPRFTVISERYRDDPHSVKR